MEKRQRARIPWAIVLLIVLLCCALAYGGARLYRNLSSRNSFGHYRTLDIANLQGLQAVSDGFVYYDGSTISSISSAGKVRWSYLVGANAGFHATDSGVAIWQGRTLTLIDGEDGATSFNGTMDEDVLSAHVDVNYTAVLLGTETNGTMLLMEPGGKQVSRIVLEDVSVIDYGFFSNGSLLWMMVLDSNGTAPTCDIQTYRPGKEIVGSIHDNEQLSYAVLFQASRVLVAGDTYLRTYDYTGTEERAERKLIYGWYLESFDDTQADPLMVLVNDAQLQGESDIRDLRLLRSGADPDRIVRLPYGCMSVVARNDTVYGFASDGHLLVVRADGSLPQAYQLELTHIGTVYGVTRDNVAILGDGSTVYLLTLP